MIETLPKDTDEARQKVLDVATETIMDKETTPPAATFRRRLPPVPPKMTQRLKILYKSSKRSIQSKETFIQLMSLLAAEGYTNREMSDLLELSPSKGKENAKVKNPLLPPELYKLITIHAAQKAGAPCKINNNHTRQRASYEKIVTMIVKLIIERCEGLAPGREVYFDDKTKGKQPVPAYRRKESVESMYQHIINQFRLQEARRLGTTLEYDGDGKPNVKAKCIRKEDVIKIIKTVAPSEAKCEGALDSIRLAFGDENMDSAQKLLRHLRSLIERRSTIHTDANLIEDAFFKVNLAKESWSSVKVFMRHHFREHMRTDKESSTGPINHCPHHAAGIRDESGGRQDCNSECGHRHSGVCNECEEVIAVIDKLYDAVKAVCELKVTTQKQSNELKERTKDIAQRHLYYIGHEFRLVHESEYTDSVHKRLKENPNLVLVEIDWAMKWLSMRYREKMVSTTHNLFSRLTTLLTALRIHIHLNTLSDRVVWKDRSVLAWSYVYVVGSSDR